jgi:opacity protein-like surface antigen
MTLTPITSLFSPRRADFFQRECLAAVLLACMLAPVTGYTQDGPATPEATRDALGKKEGDADNATALAETLTATKKEYSMLRKGKRAITYDLSYTFVGHQIVDAATLNVVTSRGHTVRNTIAVDVGVKDNLTANFSLPLVSKFVYSDASNEFHNRFGDMSVGVRFQPMANSRSAPNMTVSASMGLPTGRSPFVGIDSNASTGSGTYSGTVGVNLSKVIDPVALFGSANVTLSLPAKNLEQLVPNTTKLLREVHPGQAFSFGAGFSYALSYNITTTMSFQQSITGGTRLVYEDTSTGEMTDRKTASSNSGMLNFGLGVRVSPITTMNFSIGMGLTSDSPDFTLGMNMPLNF